MITPIAFNRDFAPAYGVLETLAPGIRRMVASNSGPFTFTGTNSYVLGEGDVALIDPGPDDPRYQTALANALQGERITHIFLTHRHSDHAGGAARLQQITGAKILALPYHPVATKEAGETHIISVITDEFLAEGMVVTGGSWSLETITTPGHTSDHTCFALPSGAILTGDHVMGWSSTVVIPPAGSMASYRASLAKFLKPKLLEHHDAIYYPAHGGPIVQPQLFITGLIQHRAEREQQIITAISQAPMTIADLVARLYQGLDPALTTGAAMSVKAHLIELLDRGEIVRSNESWPAAHFSRRRA